MANHFLKNLANNEEGVTTIEFGLLALPMFVMIFGSLELGHRFYVQSVIDGVMEKAARTSSLEANATVTRQEFIDFEITDAIKTIAPNATVEKPSRRFYKTFSEAAKAEAEEFTDTNGNGICDNGEPFVDENENSVWDEDGAADGQGLARDVVLINVNISYPRLFPFIPNHLGWSDTVEITSDTVLANQPYSAQERYSNQTIQNCPLDT